MHILFGLKIALTVLIMEPAVAMSVRSCENHFLLPAHGIQLVPTSSKDPVVQTRSSGDSLPVSGASPEKINWLMENLSGHAMILFSGFHFEALTRAMEDSGVYRSQHDELFSVLGVRDIQLRGLLYGSYGAKESIETFESFQELLEHMDPSDLRDLSERTWQHLVERLDEVNLADSRSYITDYMFSFREFDADAFMEAKEIVSKINADPQLRNLAVELLSYSTPEMVRRSIAIGKYIYDMRISIPGRGPKLGFLVGSLSAIALFVTLNAYGVVAFEMGQIMAQLTTSTVAGFLGMIGVKSKERQIAKVLSTFTRKRALRRLRNFSMQKLSVAVTQHTSKVESIESYLQSLENYVTSGGQVTSVHEIADILGEVLLEISTLAGSVFSKEGELLELYRQLKKERDLIKQRSLVSDINHALKIDRERLVSLESEFAQISGRIENLKVRVQEVIEASRDDLQELREIRSTLDELERIVFSGQSLVENALNLQGSLQELKDIDRASSLGEFLDAFKSYLEILYPGEVK